MFKAGEFFQKLAAAAVIILSDGSTGEHCSTSTAGQYYVSQGGPVTR